MKATIKTQGQQYNVTEGDVLTVDRFIDSKEGDSGKIEHVLMLGEGENAIIGTPLVEGASVSAKILENKRASKIIVFKKKRRKAYRRKRGHRQLFTAVRVQAINLGG